MAMEEEIQNSLFEIAVKKETMVVAHRLLHAIHGPQPPPGRTEQRCAVMSWRFMKKSRRHLGDGISIDAVEQEFHEAMSALDEPNRKLTTRGHTRRL